MSIIAPKSRIDAGEAEKSHTYDGSGTVDDPFVVEFQKDDPSNPMNWGEVRKWFIAAIATFSVFAVTVTSSAYSASANEVFQDFDISTEVFTVGLSLFVLGFAIGPAVWGPLILWIMSHIAMVAFLGGSAGSQNVATLLILRFFAGTFGGSPIVNSGGTIADLFPPAQRGLALTIYCVAPFLGPILGPIVGGFVSEDIGWRWVQGVCVIFIGVIGIVGTIFIPETYGPVLLQRRAHQLAKADGKVYVSVLERNQGKKKPSEVFKRALFRPWVFLFLEPIVLVASLYMAIIYGTVYMFMGAMPIVYNEDRGWSEGIGGLSFLGIAVGIIFGLIYAIWDNNSRYMKLFVAKSATAESRLPPAIVGGIALPIGMFAFAWTSYPSIHWSISIILSTPFGLGCVLVILPIMNYLIDSYTIYAASVLAAAAIFRSVVGAAFPLFTTQMYHNLGIHWASSIPAFMTLVCMPFPLIMYRYGAVVRMKCKYSFEAAEMIRKMQMQQVAANAETDSDLAPE
ncbi:Major facilitator superfamily domain general substrate transporter [Penicillium coprophilum]|uniref:Major facilitator superfamily domain general substrate transporter n=1 Tax=Penicillium coprophilum TaxID=36646 RepID=UPI002395A5B3|nr:Major facilitator superfamily domain general substrate transporter [Penicillium coprophilum]KAJ5178068.1 Major facilitator superfamily domain general substrate transporter [Penicillium coprophilum]